MDSAHGYFVTVAVRGLIHSANHHWPVASVRAASGARSRCAHFRFLLQGLSEAWAARGPSRSELDAGDPWPAIRSRRCGGVDAPTRRPRPR